MSDVMGKIRDIYRYYIPKDKQVMRMPRVCAMTMNYNDNFHLRHWISYYGRELSEKNLFIIDHDSDESSKNIIGERQCSVINLPRDFFDDTQRADFVSGIASSLLRFYDVIIYADCDEIVMPDPRKYTGLIDFFSKNRRDSYTCIGLNVFHDIFEEAPFRHGVPVFSQRRYARFFSPMCKTSAATTPIHWYGGFHGSDLDIDFGDFSLFMFHMRELDFGQKLDRLSFQRDFRWIDEFAGYRNQRIPNKILFEQWMSMAGWQKSDKFHEVFDHAKKVKETAGKVDHFNVVDLNHNPEVLYAIPPYFPSPF